jgi:hypothetical protein
MKLTIKNQNIIKKTALLLFFSYSALSLGGCAPSVFGVSQKQWAQMSPDQQQVQIQRYNAQQAEAAREKPMWDSLEAIAGAVGNSPKVRDATTHQHCSNNTPPPVCQKNPDGSVHCTQQSSASCESIGL